MEFAQACRAQGVRPITGAELTVIGDGSPPPSPGFRGNCPPGAFHLTLLVADATGYRNLCRLLTRAHAETREGADPSPPAVRLAEVVRLAEGLVCLSGCARDGALAGRIARGDRAGAERLGKALLGAFGRDRFRVELQVPLWRGDRTRNRRLAELAAAARRPPVATGNVHAHDRGRVPLQDALVAVRLGGTLESTEPGRRGNGAATLVSPERAAARFREHPDAVAETARLAERLRFDLTTDLGYSYPGAEDGSADRRLAEACRARFGERYDGKPERAEAERRLEQELNLIAGLKLSGFFLLHRDLLELAREVAVEVRGPDSARSLLPPGRGRGSSVSSVVCYLTGLSHVDPVGAGLFLGRFLNEEIAEAPDIDLDFPRDVRERLIPRIHERYGAERSALVAAFPTYRSKGAIRDFGKVLGLPPGEIERAARSASHYERAELEGDSTRRRALAKLLDDAYGLPRHPSQHPGGMVLSTQPLTDLCPVVPAAMEGRQIAQWDKDSCADAGFLKIDLLGLGMLSAVERTVTEIARVRGERIDLSRIPLDDPEVYRRIQAAETTGVFQIESRAQMQMLPRSRPENIEDLTVQVAIVRPGPIQGGAVHPYLERKKRLREDPSYEIPYEHPEPRADPLRHARGDRLPGPGHPGGDGAGRLQLRRGGGPAAGDEPEALRGGDAGPSRALRRGGDRPRRRRSRSPSGSSARSTASPASASRSRTPPRSACSPTSRPGCGSTTGPSSSARCSTSSRWASTRPTPSSTRRSGAGSRCGPPDVNACGVLCRVERGDGGTGPGGADRARLREGADRATTRRRSSAERERGGAYRDLGDLASRSGAGRDGLERLAWAGACGELEAGGDRRRAPLWRLGVARGSGDGQLPLPLPMPDAPALAEQTPWERVTADYGAYGIALEEHPLTLLRGGLDPATVTCAALERIRDGSELVVAGLLVARQRPATGQGRDVPADRGRDRGRERDRRPARLRAPPADRADGLAGHGHRPARAPRGRRQRRRERGPRGSSVPMSRSPRSTRSSVAHPERETGRDISDLDAVLPVAHSFGAALRPGDHGASSLARTCVRPTPLLSSLAMRTTTDMNRTTPPQRSALEHRVAAIDRVADRIDLAIDLLTLGQYGLECREARRNERLRGEQAPDPDRSPGALGRPLARRVVPAASGNGRSGPPRRPLARLPTAASVGIAAVDRGEQLGARLERRAERRRGRRWRRRRSASAGSG